RVFHVTGVQTCALPILSSRPLLLIIRVTNVVGLQSRAKAGRDCRAQPALGAGCKGNPAGKDRRQAMDISVSGSAEALSPPDYCRSEERRVGKEWSTRWR